MQAPEAVADDGAFDLVLAALTPDLAAPQTPAATPLPQAKDAKPAPVEPAPEDVTKVLPRPVVVARADIRPVSLPAPKLASAKPAPLPAPKPAAPPSTDDKDAAAVAPIRPVIAVTAKPVPMDIIADAAKPQVVQAPAAPPPVEAPVPVPVEIEAKPAPKPTVSVADKTPRAAPQPIIQDATPVQEIEHEDPQPEPSVHEQPAQPQTAPEQQPAQAATTVAVSAHATPAPAHIASTPVPAHTATPAEPEPQPNLKALAAQIVAKAAPGGTKTFEIRLDPPELGRVEVHLTVSHDGKAEATLTAERPETVALLQRDSQNLERTLKDAGLDVSNSSLNFSLKGEQQGQGDGGGASKAHTRSLSDAVVARSEAVNASLANRSAAPSSARLDIFV